MPFSVADLASLLVIGVLTIGQATSYPYVLHQQRKADPFVALANTLRQEQEQEALHQQQQRLDNGYYYDYGHDGGPSDDDLYQMAQFQRELSRAAVAPFFGRTQRSSWSNVMLDDGQYGYPVKAEATGNDQQEAPLSEWYDTAVDADRAYDEEEMVREQQQKEGQLLMDMLTEYMLMYGGAGQPEVGEESKRAAVSGEKQTENITEATEKHGDQSEATTTVMTTTMTTDVQQPHRKEKQPPVRKSQDGTPLGQQEFPMMRPATPQRNQWLAATQMLQNQNLNSQKNIFQSTGLDNTNKKRHYKAKNLTKKSSIVTSEDELIDQLDNLKMKKN